MRHPGGPGARIFALALLAWALVIVAGYFAIRWIPIEPMSAAGDLSYTTPAVASFTAMLASLLAMLTAAPKITLTSRTAGLLVVAPAGLALLAGLLVYVRL